MTRREPSAEAILAARLQRAYPSLSPYSSASLAQQLCAIERMQRRHAERRCSGENGGYIKRERAVLSQIGGRQQLVAVHDPDAEERAGKRIDRKVCAWVDKVAERQVGNRGAITTAPLIELEGDPRGAVLKVRLPGEAEAVSV